MRAACRERIRGFRGTKIIRVKIPVHEYFGKFQHERAAKIGRSFYFRYARDILPEIVYKFAFRRADRFLHGKTLCGAHGFAHLRRERGFIERHFHRRKRLIICREI